MTGNNNLDERENRLIGNAMAIAAIFAFIYEIVIIIYNLNKIGNIKTVYTEIILVIAMFFSMVAYYITTAEYDSSIEKGKKEKTIVKIDEREKLRIIRSVGMAGIIAMIYSFGVIIFRLIQTKKFESSYTFIGLIAVMIVIITIYHIINKEYDVPKTFFGKKLPLGDSKESKRARIVYYIKDALRSSTIFLVFDIMNPDRLAFSIPSIDWKYMPYILELLRRVILFLIMNYAWGEFNIKKQRKFNQSLDDGEIDDI